MDFVDGEDAAALLARKVSGGHARGPGGLHRHRRGLGAGLSAPNGVCFTGTSKPANIMLTDVDDPAGGGFY